MLRRVAAAFFLSFGAVLGMLFLYVYLPQYLVSRFSPSSTPSFLGDLLTNSLPAESKFRLSPPTTPAPTPVPSPALVPATLIIPKLNIQSAVEQVGVTENKNMDVPKNAADVAWYMYGAKPGEVGNAVIAGHYDTPTGKPAIFYYLGKLIPGDELEVVSENAVRSTFVVAEKASIPYDKFPNEHVFKSRPGKNLNLITCGGIWDPKKRTYLERLVVYTTLKEASISAAR